MSTPMTTDFCALADEIFRAAAGRREGAGGVRTAPCASTTRYAIPNGIVDV